MRRLERQDRINFFYGFEERALSPRDANRTWLIYNGKTWTWREAYDVVLKYAEYLQNTHGIKRREVVALDFTNKPSFLFFKLALWSLGAVPAFINTSVTGNALVHSLSTAGARLAIVDEEVAGHFTPEVVEQMASCDLQGTGKGTFKSIIFDDALEESIVRDLKGMRAPDKARSGAGINSGYRNAGLVFTSGTTGLPKAAYVGYFKCYASVSFATRWAGIRRDDVFYTCMPMYHLSASTMAFIPSLFLGYGLALGHRFSTRTFWPEVRASRATIILYVGETCRYLLSAPVQRDPDTGADLDKAHHVRLAYGNGLRPDIWQRFQDRFGIEAVAEFYSATESPFATWNLSRNAFGVGAVGRVGSLLRLQVDSKIAIVELDWATETPKRFPAADGSDRPGFCRRVAPGAVGEMLAALDPAAVATSYQGYHNNAKASGSKVLRDVFQDGDAWYRTGDTLRLDAEGRFFFHDRIGDTFRWRAENVATTEVAEALGAHPHVAEANVYGVAVPHHDGRAGCAAVMFRDGGGGGDAGFREPSPEVLHSVAQHVSESLPKFAVPLFVRVVREMGTTGTNKQQKHVLRAQGVDPQRLGPEERLYWLRDGDYVPFGQREWEALQGGRVRL